MEKSPFQTWITDGTGNPFYARKEFVLETVPDRAEALVCGLGQFNFYVNGKKVSDHVLDPAWSSYDRLIYYVRFDITDYLVPGKNVLAAEVGNGWYEADTTYGYFFHFPEFMPENPNGYHPFNDELVLTVHAQIGDLVIDTDESWLVHPHPILHSNCYGSEMIDGRRIVPGWNEVRQKEDPTGWRPAQAAIEGEALNAVVAEQTMPPVKVIHTYEGKYLRTVNGHAIYDFGQNCAGLLSFDVRGEAGDVVHAYPAEKTNERGDADQVAKNWLDIDVKETYVLNGSGSWEKFQMTFTYVGCRYVAFDTDPEHLRNVTLQAITSAWTDAGSFQCDDERYLQVYHLVEKAVESNMVSVHTDCPTIERFAWQEENHLMAPAIMYMKDVRPHWEKFMRDTRTAQLTENDWFHDMHHGRYYPGNGLIPSQAPCYVPNVLPVPGLGDFYNVIGWGSSIILGTYWHYQFYGDRKIIEDNYEAGKKYLAFLKTCVNEEGFINNGLGDWGNPTQEYAKENVETAFLYADADRMRYFAKTLGRKEDAENFAAFAERIRENYNRKLLVFNQETGRWCYRVWDKKDYIVCTQASQAMPLFWGMVPVDKEQDVVESFRQVLKEDGALVTGEVGQPYIIQTMTKYGMDDMLCEMIMRKIHPSYYAFVLDGETSLGEYWEKNPRSHCHDMMGHIIEWYYNGIAGIRPEKPGFRSVIVRPYLPRSMNHVDCTYHSASGQIHVVMDRLKDGMIGLEASADSGIELTVDRTKLDQE